MSAWHGAVFAWRKVGAPMVEFRVPPPYNMADIACWINGVPSSISPSSISFSISAAAARIVASTSLSNGDWGARAGGSDETVVKLGEIGFTLMISVETVGVLGRNTTGFVSTGERPTGSISAESWGWNATLHVRIIDWLRSPYSLPEQFGDLISAHLVVVEEKERQPK